MEQRVPLYLKETLDQVIPVYQAAKDSNNDDYKTAQPAELAIVTKQLAAGASELRDMIVDAWRQSANVTVGFPLVRVGDIESGAVKMTPAHDFNDFEVGKRAGLRMVNVLAVDGTITLVDSQGLGTTTKVAMTTVGNGSSLNLVSNVGHIDSVTTTKPIDFFPA